MAKKIFQDIVPQRSIRHIPLSHKRSDELIENEQIPHEEPRIDDEPEAPVNHRSRPTKNIQPHTWLWFIVFLSVGFLVFVFSFIFSGAQITISPRVEAVHVNASFVAFTNSADSFSYEVLTLEKTETKKIEASGVEKVERKASGVITIANAGSVAQRFVKNTRIQSAKGMMYRLDLSVTVPARKIKVGASPISGTIDVSVHADAAGDSYNISDSSTFTIPGLKGTPKFGLLTAKIKTAIKGGFIGTVKKVAVGEEDAARTELQNTIKGDLVRDAFSKKTDGYVLYPQAVFLNFTRATSSEESDSADTSTVAVTGTLHAIIFKKARLAEEIAKQTIHDYTGNPISIDTIENLTFSIKNQNQFTLGGKNPLSFTLAGDGTAHWLYSETVLRDTLAGKNKADLRSVLDAFPAITKMDVIIRPFWKHEFPTDAKKIHIKVNETTTTTNSSAAPKP